MKDIFYTVFKFKDKDSPDTLGLYPERVHTGAFPERRYLWSSRMLVIIATISIALNMILASSFVLLLPQRTVSPNLFHVDEDFYTLVRTQPAERKALATDLLAEKDIRDYLTLRYQVTSNKESDLKRWEAYSKFYWMSSNTVYGDFEQTEKEYTNLQRARGIEREIKINWVKPLYMGLWEAQFTTYDKKEGAPTDVHVWRALIRAQYAKLPFRNKDDVIKNPYGFMVTSFYLTYAGKPKNDTKI